MKFRYFIILIGVLLTSACTPNEGVTPEQERLSDSLNPNQKMNQSTDQDMNTQLGYVRYSKDEVVDSEDTNRTTRINRDGYADMITRIILQNHGFNEVATLVTDREVLIAYDRGDDIERDDAADIAKRTARSIMPSFFDIYVSDNERLMHDIQSLYNSTTNREYDNMIEQLVDEMKKTPQGRKENINETREDLD